jgi:hypothetical protein
VCILESIVHKSLKRGIIAAAAVAGLSPGDQRWVAALSRLRGTFERGVFELSLNVAVLVFNGGIIVAAGGVAFKEYRQSGWTQASLLVSGFCLVFICLSYSLLSRLGLRYAFANGSVSAFNTWGQLIWSEHLTGLTRVSCFSGRGMTSMTLRWPDRKRGLVLFDSLRDALNASAEAPNESLGGLESPRIQSDAGPSWMCAHCHEENPGNFEECWKCQRNRAGKDNA